MVGRLKYVLMLALLAAACADTLVAQEVLLPLNGVGRQEPAPQRKSAPLELPFFDDFAAYTGVPSAELWLPGGGYVGTGFDPLPPTVGMLTLDALDATGNLYAHAVSSLFGADTVASQPLRLDGYAPHDSVVLSFYYLPGGGRGNLWERIGDMPEGTDSLMLDFYNAADSAWHTVWSRGGVSVDTLVAQTQRDWQYVAVAVADSGYFDSCFRFRFRNFASLDANAKPGMTGNCDQWSIDYVLLDQGRTVTGQPVFRDVAFTGYAPSMLKHYSAMPARQYRAGDMADMLQLHITNLYSSPLASHYAWFAVDESGDTLYRYDGGFENAPPFLPNGTYQTAAAHATPAVGFAFPEGEGERVYTICHVVREGTGGDAHQDNDTLRFVQRFGNYYAYDDGEAENGYGLTSTASHLYLACRFDLNVQDTLTAVDIAFNRTYGGENESVPFYITVWQAGTDGRPGQVLYRDAVRQTPRFDTTGPFYRYSLEQPVVVDGSVFVGFEQENNTFINLGFDRSCNNADRIYYLTGTEWQRSILSGSLMLRPCFGTSSVLGIGGRLSAQGYESLSVWPNPASAEATVGPMRPGDVAVLYDIRGRRLQSSSDGHFRLNYPAGMYVVGVVRADGQCSVLKLIIK